MNWLPTYLTWTIVDIWLTTYLPHLVHVVCEPKTEVRKSFSLVFWKKWRQEKTFWEFFYLNCYLVAWISECHLILQRSLVDVNHDATFFIKRLRQLSSKVHTRKLRGVGTRGAGGWLTSFQILPDQVTGDRLCTPHKVHIFWEGHNFLRNLHLTFVLCSASHK